jgi:hypothetical protein
MAHRQAGDFEKRVLDDPDLRQILRDTDLLPLEARLEVVIRLAEAEGFTLDEAAAESALVSLDPREPRRSQD